jgi:hypothetical protein
MSYTEKITKLHRGLTPIYPDQDRLNFGPQLRGDIRLLLQDDTYLEFNTIDTDGTVWVISDIDGWWNLAQASIPDVERGFGDGSFEVSGRFLARDLTITGSILVTKGTRAEIDLISAEARDRLTLAFNLVKNGGYLIVDEDIYKRASFVRLSGRPEISTVNSRGRIDFSIGLRAVDPLKYEWIESEFSQASIYNGRYNIEIAGIEKSNLTETDFRVYDYNEERGYDSYEEVRAYSGNTNSLVSFPSQVNILNRGNNIVFCYFRISGPLYGPATIINSTTGQTISINSPSSFQVTNFYTANNTKNTFNVGQTGDLSRVLSVDEFLDIDTKTREVRAGLYVDGNATQGEASSRGLLDPFIDWIYLQPGTNKIEFADSGAEFEETTATLEIYWRSGWIG